jgi:Dynamin central region/Dynamin family
LYPWIQNPDSKKYDLATTTNKADIEKMIRVAQLVVLNPSLKNPEQCFLNWLNDDPHALHGSLEFSPNVIVLNITASGHLPISFYDLPGVINQAPDGKYHTVKLIRQLVKEYVEEPHTLVLLAVSMESDIEVSTTSGLLNEIEGANDRCMGVLTKPDRRPCDGDISKYRGVLENRMFQKKHGYFVTRQPAQSEIHALDYEGARGMEDKFFRSSEWMRDFPGFEDKVGTRNIRSALSNKLRALILQCLPKVMDMITQKLVEIEKDLKSLPEPSQDPVRIVSELARSFEECLIDKFGDKFRLNQLRQGWITDKKQFRDSVLSLKPSVAKLSKSERQTYAVPQGSCEDDDECLILEVRPKKE